jgi:hypothetical protein
MPASASAAHTACLFVDYQPEMPGVVCRLPATLL